MGYIIDIETNGLDPDLIWCVVIINESSEEMFSYASPSGMVVDLTCDNPNAPDLRAVLKGCAPLIGHNLLGYDVPVLEKFFNINIPKHRIEDTLVMARLLNAGAPGGHSLSMWGKRLKQNKTDFNKFDEFSWSMVDYCKQDTRITLALYRYLKEKMDDSWSSALEIEHKMQQYCEDMKKTGFRFNVQDAVKLKKVIEEDRDKVYDEMRIAFPRRSKLIREITPTLTNNGTLHGKDFLWMKGERDLSGFEAGCPFSLVVFEDFNPRSPKQVIDRIREWGWDPYDKTDGHLKLERKIRDRRRKQMEIPDELYERLEEYQVYGWRINEDNLSTMSYKAPPEAHLLTKYLMLASRVSTLESWINEYNEKDGKIHGNFHSIGAWTGRMAHSKPNVANIPRSKAPYGKAMRQLWMADKGYKLLGCDAAGIQLRVLAHYLDDPVFTEAVCHGKEEEGTDIHSMNQNILAQFSNSVTRDTAKTFIYAWVLNAGEQQTAKILNCSVGAARQARDEFLHSYEGLPYLKEEVIPEIARLGYFIGFDGRKVIVPSEHHVLAGFLQNGETVVMKHATDMWHTEAYDKKLKFHMVNLVHDEWQVCVEEDCGEALGNCIVSSLKHTGELLNLKCPMDGNFKIGDTWGDTH